MSTAMVFGLVLLAALAASFLAGAALRLEKARRHFLDMPNHRSLHATPVPRSGGLAIVAGVLAGAVAMRLVSVPLPGWQFWVGWALLLVVSLIDDLRGLSVRIRLAAQVLAAVLLLWSIAAPGVTVAWLGVAVVSLVWFVNLFNFMDGMDGLAATMAMTGAAVLAVAAAWAGALNLAFMFLVVCAASAGFLFHNFPPARLFMGDTGSVGLGFLIGALALIGVREGAFAWFVPVLAFLPFIADATLTLLARVLRGRRPWEAHREHAYQRMVLAGLGRRRVLVIEFLFMCVCQGTALWLTIAEAGG